MISVPLFNYHYSTGISTVKQRVLISPLTICEPFAEIDSPERGRMNQMMRFPGKAEEFACMADGMGLYLAVYDRENENGNDPFFYPA